MKRALALPLIAAALAIPAGLATAAPDDVRGPACADIVDTDFSYSADGATVETHLFLDTASCLRISYTLVVLDSAASPTSVTENSLPGDGDPDGTGGTPGTDSVTVTATVPQQDRDGEVCVYATTSAGRHVFDRAPDTAVLNCFELEPGTPAGGGFN